MGEEPDSAANGEMPPQEESVKVPLTEGNEVKTEPRDASNGEAKIDVPGEEEFRGLTKEELMKFSNDPFWVRLRIFLFVLFWAAWVAMLVLSIYIIIVAPRCEPPPESTWLQESPMLDVDVSGNSPQDITSLLSSLGLSALFIPNLISHRDYDMFNETYVIDKLPGLFQTLAESHMHAVTDFVPNPVWRNHPWVSNSSLVDSGTLQLNYGDPMLEEALQKLLLDWKNKKQVTGFVVAQKEIDKYPLVLNSTADLNEKLKEEDIVVGHAAIDLSDIIAHLNTPGVLKEFITKNENAWSYYKFNPMSETHRTASPEQMPPLTLALMLLPATPILQVSTSNLTEFEVLMKPLISECVELRQKDAIKFGITSFVNSTENVLAFTRSLKGTPGYAVAANLGHEPDVINFTEAPYVPNEGTLSFSLLQEGEHGTKISLEAVEVPPHSALVLQFVADYN